MSSCASPTSSRTPTFGILLDVDVDTSCLALLLQCCPDSVPIVVWSWENIRFCHTRCVALAAAHATPADCRHWRLHSVLLFTFLFPMLRCLQPCCAGESACCWRLRRLYSEAGGWKAQHSSVSEKRSGATAVRRDSPSLRESLMILSGHPS